MSDTTPINKEDLSTLVEMDVFFIRLSEMKKFHLARSRPHLNVFLSESGIQKYSVR